MELKRRQIPVFRPSLGQEVLNALEETFSSGWLGEGRKVAEFESQVAKMVGADFAIAVNSGTAALHLACLGLGLGRGDEVLVPGLSFVSTAHAPSYCGARVVFVDVNRQDGCIDVKHLSSQLSSRSRAIVVVHYAGRPADLEAIWSIAEDRGIEVIEDAAHALGAEYLSEPIGSSSRSAAVCFSFNALKNLTTGDGGMVVTQRAALSKRIRELRWLGIDRSTFQRVPQGQGRGNSSCYDWRYEVSDLGFRYAMNDITATIGVCQLKQFPERQEKRRRMAQRYLRGLSEVDGIEPLSQSRNAKSACHLFAIRCQFRDELRAHLNACGVDSSVHYFPLHLHPYYRSLETTSLPNAEKLGRELLSLPFHHGLTEEEIDYVIGCVGLFYK